MEDSVDIGTILGFTPAWSALGVVDQAFLERAKIEWDKGEDPNTEHYRYWAFREFLAAHRPITEELAIALYGLGATDADQGMGSAMMVDILYRPECPQSVLTTAATSGVRHLVQAVVRRRV